LNITLNLALYKYQLLKLYLSLAEEFFRRMDLGYYSYTFHLAEQSKTYSSK